MATARFAKNGGRDEFWFLGRWFYRSFANEVVPAISQRPIGANISVATLLAGHANVSIRNLPWSPVSFAFPMSLYDSVPVQELGVAVSAFN